MAHTIGVSHYNHVGNRTKYGILIFGKFVQLTSLRWRIMTDRSGECVVQ